ncbi:MAG: MarR family transcriptional regulator [Dehalococcoidia bacterium]|nr:MAG: MarR family transcriptional regulator [Dehalococcoidia bacterium]
MILATDLTEREYFYIWTLIRNLSHLLGKARDRELSQYGITVTQSGILYMIKALGGHANPGNIARVLYREPTTISNTLIRMEKEGLIKRTRDPKRKRQVRISLTKEGEQAYRNSANRESIKRIMSQMAERKRRQIKDLLAELRVATMHDLGLSPQSPHPLQTDFDTEF